MRSGESVSNVYVRRPILKREAGAAKALLTVPDGDHLSLLNVYNNYKQNDGGKIWVWPKFLNGRALAQVDNVRQQLQQTMERFDFDLVSTTEQRNLYVNIREASVCGLVSLGIQPDWVLFNDFVLTR